MIKTREQLARGERIPILYGLAYWDYARAQGVFYPIPINYIVCYWRRFYWGFMRFFWWIGLIDKERNEEFRWADFFRIKTH